MNTGSDVLTKFKERKDKVKSEFNEFNDQQLYNAINRWDIFQYVKSKKFAQFLVNLNKKQYEIFHKIFFSINDEKKYYKPFIESLEKGFTEEETRNQNISDEEKQKTQSLWQNFEEELKESFNKANKQEHRHDDMKLQQLFQQLQVNKHGALDKLSEFMSDKIGFDPKHPMKSLSKFLPGGNKENKNKAVSDSELDFGGGQAKSLLIGELTGKILGFSTIASLGYLAPVIFPLYAIHKVLPEGILPIIGGTKVDSLLAEGTAWNPVGKDTKMLIGKNTCHTGALKEQREKNQQQSQIIK
ncbi:MAG: hypothetical protein HRK26_04875 [Rickettsiaceae bacterium H1]|nr:hypothetical protein [Rickettsiaceae bacterium H1]